MPRTKPLSGRLMPSGATRQRGTARRSATPPMSAGSPPIARSANMPATSGGFRCDDRPMGETKAGTDGQLKEQEISALIEGRHGDPFARLGLQRERTSWIARAVVPGAEQVTAVTLDGTEVSRLTRHRETRFFQGPAAVTARVPLRYLA